MENDKYVSKLNAYDMLTWIESCTVKIEAGKDVSITDRAKLWRYIGLVRSYISTSKPSPPFSLEV